MKIFALNNQAQNLPCKQGIYKIVNKINNKCYIGSCNSIRRRFYEHSCKLFNNKHDLIDLQLDWNQFGRENFELIILEITHNLNKKELLEKETNYIKEYKLIYNTLDQATRKGKKFSEETIIKIKLARQKQIISPESYAKAVETRLKKNPNYFRDIALKNKRPFKCLETGEIFQSCKDAALALNLKELWVWRRLNKIYKKSKINFSFEFI